MPAVFEVADYFLAKNNPSDFGDRITALKLQKLVYYAQGHALAALGRPLFPELIKAWEHGPVCVALYHRFKDFADQPLDRIFESEREAAKALKAAGKPFTADETLLMDDILACYGGYTAGHLRRMTHETAPWRDAFPDGVIKAGAMKKYFAGRLKAVKVEILRLTREEADALAMEAGLIQ